MARRRVRDVSVHLIVLASLITLPASFGQQGPKIAPASIEGRAGFGTSSALSADGNTAIIGGPADWNGTRGAVWILIRSAGQWTQQGSKLVDPAGGASGQGKSVAISADGNTAIVGGDNDTSSAGAAWIWTRTGGSWSQQAKLIGTGAGGTTSHQGYSVAMSTDGNTVAVGGPNDNGQAGAVWIWTRSGGVWTQQGAKLVGSGASGPARQGESVGLSADGNTLVVGANNDNSGGAAWIWTRTGGVWTQQGSKLVGTGAAGFARQGQSVAISADGNTSLVGGSLDNSNAGAVWVWTRSGGVWSQQGTKLTAGAAGGAQLGTSVSISSDGNTAVFGGPGDESGKGAVWVFTRSGNSWSQFGSKRVGTDPIGSTFTGAQQGASVSLSGDATTFVEGSLRDYDLKGAVWFFAASGFSEPGAFIKTAPVNGATNESISATLSWTISSGATGYEYCYDTLNDNDCVSWIPVGNALSARLRCLLPDTQYFWQVRATNDSGSPTYADGGLAAFSSFTTKPNMLTNGNFSTGDLSGWQAFATPDQSYIVTEGPAAFLQFYRVPPPPNQSNQAVVFQNTGVSLASGEAIEAHFEIGNSSNVRKRLSILLHDADFTDLSVCTFWLGPHTQLSAYGMRTHTTRPWTNATISFYAATPGSDGGYYEVDTAVVVHGPPQATDRTECDDPSAPGATSGAAGPEMLANGGFDAGLNGWSTFGQLDQQVSAGVFEFRSPPPGDPAGVLLQPTGAPVAARSILTSSFELGNSSAVRKRVTVLVHDRDFSDLTACTFFLAPGQPLTQYTMRSFTTRAWTNATISIYGATTGMEAWTRLDNVSLRETPSAATIGTECLEGTNGNNGNETGTSGNDENERERRERAGTTGTTVTTGVSPAEARSAKAETTVTTGLSTEARPSGLAALGRCVRYDFAV